MDFDGAAFEAADVSDVFQSCEKTTTVNGQAIWSSQKSRKWTPFTPSLTLMDSAGDAFGFSDVLGGFVDGDAVGGEECGGCLQEGQHRDQSRDSDQDIAARCRALPGWTGGGVRPYVGGEAHAAILGFTSNGVCDGRGNN